MGQPKGVIQISNLNRYFSLVIVVEYDLIFHILIDINSLSSISLRYIQRTFYIVVPFLDHDSISGNCGFSETTIDKPDAPKNQFTLCLETKNSHMRKMFRLSKFLTELSFFIRIKLLLICSCFPLFLQTQMPVIVPHFAPGTARRVFATIDAPFDVELRAQNSSFDKRCLFQLKSIPVVQSKSIPFL